MAFFFFFFFGGGATTYYLEVNCSVRLPGLCGIAWSASGRQSTGCHHPLINHVNAHPLETFKEKNPLSGGRKHHSFISTPCFHCDGSENSVSEENVFFFFQLRTNSHDKKKICCRIVASVRSLSAKICHSGM